MSRAATTPDAVQQPQQVRLTFGALMLVLLLAALDQTIVATALPTIVSVRTAIEARVLVTSRMPPLRMDDRAVHQIGLPYHWGVHGLASGDSANDLFGIVLDPNVHIQETKAATCDVRPGRRPRGPALLELRAGIGTAKPDR